jgi:hypothetical protein
MFYRLYNGLRSTGKVGKQVVSSVQKIPEEIIPGSNCTGFISSVHQSTLMHTSHLSDDVKLGLIIILIFSIAIIAFWLPAVFIWAIAIVVALPIHQRFYNKTLGFCHIDHRLCPSSHPPGNISCGLDPDHV